MASLEQLLSLQEHDTAADQLHHRRDTLPERAELATGERELATLETEQATTEEARDVVRRTQKRLEDEVAAVEAKVAEVHAKLYGGGLTSPRELQTLQDEEAALKRHQTAVEDKVLEQMELAVPLDEQLGSLAARRSALQARLGEVNAALVASEADIDRQLAEVDEERAGAAAGIDPALLARYEQLRTDLGGIAVARLVGTNCGGCHLALSAVELDRIRHLDADQAVLCEECGRLLVRS
jgi:predicted  nucleic acid-binding Zn-ribbon protein